MYMYATNHFRKISCDVLVISKLHTYFLLRETVALFKDVATMCVHACMCVCVCVCVCVCANHGGKDNGWNGTAESPPGARKNTQNSQHHGHGHVMVANGMDSNNGRHRLLRDYHHIGRLQVVGGERQTGAVMER